MNILSVKELEIQGSYIITSSYYDDLRGSFIKNFEKKELAQNGIDFECSETFLSTSAKYVIRGLHFQTRNPQAKIVGVISGKVFDVIVDLRKNSPTYRKWIGVYLSRENRDSLFIPRGCAHGFISLTDDSIVNYICDGEYDKETDTGIYAFDSDLNIEWPIYNITQAIMSKRDRQLMKFEDFDKINPFTL